MNKKLKISLIQFSFFLMACYINAQNELFEIVDFKTNDVAPNELLKGSQHIRINLSLFDSNEIHIPSSSGNKEFHKHDIVKGGVPFKIWSGYTNSEFSSCLFVINNNRISGMVMTREGNYDIYPSKSPGLHILQRIDDIPIGGCGNEENRDYEFRNEPIPQDNNGQLGVNSLISGEECFVRLIVAYTDAAKTFTFNTFNRTMVEHISIAVALANQGYQQGAATVRVELAHLYNTTSDETNNICTDVDDLQSSSDSRFNEIHTRRNTYDADMCCLITDHVYTSAQDGCNSGALCGIAFDFEYQDDANMFQITSASCIAQFSFVHEFAHTQGCRHDNDNTGDPFSYARGFVSSTGNFRTIMAVNSNPEPRLNLFSNPGVIEPVSNLPAGTSTRDNAKALDVGDFTVAHHRTTPTNFSNSSTIGDDELVNMVAVNNITSTNFALSGSVLELKAQNSVVLSPGFGIKEGASGLIHIIPECDASYSIKSNNNSGIK